jgi:hypothetical protein
LNGESARLAERQRLLMATADVQRLRLACHWQALAQQTRPQALAAAAFTAARQHGHWLALLAPLLLLVVRRVHHRHGTSAPWLGDVFWLVRWALRRVSGGRP